MVTEVAIGRAFDERLVLQVRDCTPMVTEVAIGRAFDEGLVLQVRDCTPMVDNGILNPKPKRPLAPRFASGSILGAC